MPRITGMDRLQAFQKQAVIAYNINMPTINVWYEACDLSGGLKVNYIRAEQDNDALAAINIEVRATIDGIVCGTGVWAPANGTAQYLYLAPAADALAVQAALINAKHDDSLECHAIKIEIRTTQAVGAGTDLYIFAQYEEKEFV